MADFNFTVRATDDLGAFSERSFSVTVNNTMVTQYMVSTAQGHLATSVDGINWTYQLNMFNPSQGGGRIINANGFWLVTKNNTEYLRSTDGLNWTTHRLPTSHTFVGDTSWHPTFKHKFAYAQGKIAMISFGVPAGFGVPVPTFLSTEDGLTWTTGGRITDGSNNGASATYYFYNYQLEYGNGIWYAPTNMYNGSGYLGAKSIDGGATWTPIGYTATNNSYGFTNVSFMNGLWFASTKTRSYFISNDLVSWTEIPAPASWSTYYMFSNALYVNGRIISFPEAWDATNAGSTPSGTKFPKAQISVDAINWTSATGVVPTAEYTSNDGGWQAHMIGGGNQQGQHYVSSMYHNGKILAGSRRIEQGATGLVCSVDGGDTFTAVDFKAVDSSNPASILYMNHVRLIDTV